MKRIVLLLLAYHGALLLVEVFEDALISLGTYVFEAFEEWERERLQ